MKTLEDLRGKDLILCTPFGAANSAAIEKMIADGDLFRVRPSKWEGCFKMLATGRVNVVGQPEVTGYWNIKKSGVDRNIFKSVILEPNSIELHLVISKIKPGAIQLIQRFNLGLTKIKENGTYSRIFSEFLD